MGWKIACLENTAKVPFDHVPEVARAVVGGSENFYYVEDDVPNAAVEAVFGYMNGKREEKTLMFDTDDMEHMDYITGNERGLKAMAAAGVTGRILFGSLEGDNFGKFWGVEFASGHYRPLTGSLNWTAGTSIPA